MYNKNLEFINNNELKNRLKRISLEESRKNISFCITPSNDYLLMKNDVPMDDINNPRQAIKEMLKSTIKNPMGKNDIIITFGIGLCYLLDEVFNAYPSKIFIYEPDIHILHFVLNNVDISEHLSSGRVFISNDLNEIMNQLSEVYITNDKIEVVFLKNYAIVKSQELLELTQKVYETCRSKTVDVNTIAKYSKQWTINTLANINSYNNNPNTYLLSELEGKFSGQTALILAPGPSLNENIEKIKANRDKFVIFAVNKVLRILDAHHIVPDFAVCLDSIHVDVTLRGIEDLCSKTNCIMDIKSDTSLFSKNFKRVFVAFSQNDILIKKLSEYNKFNTYEIGGTATTLALVTAAKLGFSKIIFAGMDLAFKDDVMYATGEVSEKISTNAIKINNVEKKLVQVKSVTGDNVLTREDYAAFIQHFETIIKDLGVREVYNTTSFGAKIEGMKNIPFENIPLFFVSNGTPFILGEAKHNKILFEAWTKDELIQINVIIAMLSKNIFSPSLISSIVKSSLMYQYMQADILSILQSKFEPELAESFILRSKQAIKALIDNLQKNRLI